MARVAVHGVASIGRSIGEIGADACDRTHLQGRPGISAAPDAHGFVAVRHADDGRMKGSSEGGIDGGLDDGEVVIWKRDQHVGRDFSAAEVDREFAERSDVVGGDHADRPAVVGDDRPGAGRMNAGHVRQNDDRADARAVRREAGCEARAGSRRRQGQGEDRSETCPSNLLHAGRIGTKVPVC
jgi:hypothetical protein